MFETQKSRSAEVERLERLWQKPDSRLKNGSRRKLTYALAVLLVTGGATGLSVGVHELSRADRAFSVPTGTVSTLATVDTANVPVAATKSTLTAIVDTESLTASYYWTLALKAYTDTEQEAAFDLKIPEGSVVSRVTLWVNGVAQEASFNSQERVSSAYNSVVSMRRDPVLVTWKSPDTVHIQAYPVNSTQDFQLRIGVTAPLSLDEQNQIAFKMPYIHDQGLNFDTIQDLHLQSDVPLTCKGAKIIVERQNGNQSGFLIRSNPSAEKMEQISFEGIRASSANLFASRLTHAYNHGYVVASVNKEGLKLSTSETMPNTRLITKEDTAVRLSTLWAIQTINKLVAAGERSRAVDLARSYRLVSPISGATVLEADRDYQRFGLDRDQYRSSNFDAFEEDTGGAPLLQGATNGRIGPQGEDAAAITGVNTTGIVRINRDALRGQQIAESLSKSGGPITEKTVASNRDANSMGNIFWVPTRFDSQLLHPAFILVYMGLAYLLFFAGLSFVGGSILTVRALTARGKRRAILLAAGITWLALGHLMPGASQIILLFAFGALTVAKVLKTVRAKA